jgi:signal transduction histidine kinase
MVLKKSHFPILYFLALWICSCNKEQKSNLRLVENSGKLLAIGDDYMNKGYSDSAYYYYNKSKIISENDGNNPTTIYALLKIAAIQQMNGDYYGTEDTATEALDFFEPDTDPAYKCYVYNILGINYKMLFDYDQSLQYYNKSLAITVDELQKSIVKNNIAVTYIEKGSYKKVIPLLTPLLEKKEVKNHPETHARVLDNLGFTYFKMDYPNAIDYLKQSLQMRLKIKDDFGTVTSYLHLSEYHEKNNVSEAKQYAVEAYKIATKINSVDDRLLALNKLLKYSDGLELKKISRIQIRLNDSIYKVRQMAKNQFAKIRYDSRKEKDENLKLKSQKQKLIYGISIFGIVAVFTVLLIRARNRRQQLKSVYDTETKLSKQLHDELANDFFHAMTYAETQDLQDTQKKETFLDNLENIYNRIRNISKENNSIDTGQAYETILTDMLSTFNTSEINVIIKKDAIDWKNIASEKKIVIHRMLQELMVNMKKHSHCSLVLIGFATLQNKIEITYSDNGVGDANGLFFKKGLQNVENRIHAIKGTINFAPNDSKGFRIRISFPK